MAARKTSAQKKAASRKASKIRIKIEDGTATESDLEFLAEYDQTKGKPGRPPNEESAEDEPEAVDPDADTVVDPVDGSAPVDAAPAPAPAPMPKLPPPPRLSAPPRVRVEADEPNDKKAKGSDWRDKYRSGPSGTSRELTVTKVAEQWRNILIALTQGMEAAGVKPLIDPNELYPSMVLVLDEVIPAHVELTPKVIALGGTTALIVQRFIRRKEIAEALAKEQEREEFRKRNEARRENAERAAEESQHAPTPTPSDDPAAVPPESAAPASDFGSDVIPINGVPPRFAGLSSREILAADPTAVI
jgi:hypothetical protein